MKGENMGAELNEFSRHPLFFWMLPESEKINLKNFCIKKKDEGLYVK
jgi:hypothetical protein